MRADDHSRQKYYVAFLMNGAKPPRGAEYLTLDLITHLRKDTFYPIVIYIEEGEIVSKIKKAGIKTIRVPLSKKITSFYPREAGVSNPVFIISFLWHLLKSGIIIKVIKVLRTNKIQLIYCSDNLSKLIGGICGKITGIKVVAHCHDIFSEKSLYHGSIRIIMKPVYLLFLSKIIAVSERARKYFTLGSKVSQKVITIYNGIDTKRYDPDKIDTSLKKEFEISEEDLTIGSIGTLDQNKGQKYLIEAIERLKADGITNIACLICGTGEDEKYLKELVREKNLTKEVLFLGFRKDIPRVLRILDIMVMTSFAESFSMSIVEAMAMEVPVIGTNVGGIPEVVDDGKTGIIVPPGNIDALCEAIKYLIQNPGIRFQMGKNGRVKVLEKFTIEENVRKTEDVFLSLMVT
ncbi:MAG: hypothetical protein A3C43_09660 [Candidatus Schekmanbacteria bacterium RIFCSPHIGHO2_02_FULL_38_11]|uniref:Glycosyl transferase family 1 domain-containing protein n=1 Tax=Candidatus Schekmanbacteria bacterium RIFCSPLOWO2_12_FULL_38_15 TaxID=1817883 RepID=A0A1F7SKR6_9BACT|nr:MAG: hypothetical protein A3C43_09660 [Candidatus Schekmanbacteria bacterium RIFCSPHIGHO2_02_FULL_38_11]OGL54363.1 MAG: hypothetical protein A3G31_09390 [Candidatus Schekmanbacteria bacterium RIFCSPLOWO2_12_FULL_38_15]